MKALCLTLFAVALTATACSSAPDADSTERTSSASTTTPTVHLLRAQSVIDGNERLFFTIAVQAAPSSEDVFVHMSEGGGPWTDYPAKLATTVTTGTEIWKAEVDPTSTVDVEFVVAVTADGITTWDNNAGANYKLGENHGSLLGGESNVLLDFAQMTPAMSSVGGVPAVFGGVDLRNIAYAKDVTLVLERRMSDRPDPYIGPAYSLNEWTGGSFQIPKASKAGSSAFR